MQNEDRAVPLTARQKRALQQRGDIHDPASLKKQAGERGYEKLLDDKEAVANFKGQTLRELIRDHGAGVKCLFRKGELHVVLPTHKEMCDNLESGSLKLASNTHTVAVAARQMGRTIELCTWKEDGSIQPLAGTKNKFFPGAQEREGAAIKLAFIPGKDDQPGHYAPLVKSVEGKWQLCRIKASKRNDACFAQSMLFVQACEKHGYQQAMRDACCVKKQEEYYRFLGRFARRDPHVKSMYLQGSSVKTSRVVGGSESQREALAEKFKQLLEKQAKHLSPELLKQMAEKYALSFIHQIETAELTKNMSAQSLAKQAQRPDLAFFSDPETNEERKKLERHMREDVFGFHNKEAPTASKQPNDLAHPVYFGLNILEDNHGAAPFYSGMFQFAGREGNKYFGHHLVVEPDPQHLLSYYYTDTLQDFNHNGRKKLSISTSRKDLWEKMPMHYVTDEVLEKFMSTDPASRGVYKTNSYLEAHVHRGTTPLCKRHIKKVALDFNDPHLGCFSIYQ